MNVERLEKPEGVWFLVAGHGVHALLLLLPSLMLAGIWELPFDVLLLAVVIVTSAFLESHWTPIEGGCELPATPMTRTRNKLHASDLLAIRVAWLVGATLLGLLWAAQIERSLCIAPIDPAWQLLGGLALLAGCGLRLSAIATLGPAFVSDICLCGPRVRRGIYAWIQHPSELGLVLLGSGGPLLVAAPRTTVAALMLLVPAAIWRIRREELAWSGGTLGSDPVFRLSIFGYTPMKKRRKSEKAKRRKDRHYLIAVPSPGQCRRLERPSLEQHEKCLSFFSFFSGSNCVRAS